MRHSRGVARPLAPLAPSAAMSLKAVSRLSRIPAGTGGPHGTPASGDGRAGPGHAVEVGLADVPGRVAADRGDGPEGTRSSPDWAGSPGPGVARAGAPWGRGPGTMPSATDGPHRHVGPAGCRRSPRRSTWSRPAVRPRACPTRIDGSRLPGSTSSTCPESNRRKATGFSSSRATPASGKAGISISPLKSLSSATHGIGR